MGLRSVKFNTHISQCNIIGIFSIPQKECEGILTSSCAFNSVKVCSVGFFLFRGWLSSGQRCPCILSSSETVGGLVVCWSLHALLLPAAGNERCFGTMMMMSSLWLLTVWKTNLFIPTRPTLSRPFLLRKNVCFCSHEENQPFGKKWAIMYFKRLGCLM